MDTIIAGLKGFLDRVTPHGLFAIKVPAPKLLSPTRTKHICLGNPAHSKC